MRELLNRGRKRWAPALGGRGAPAGGIDAILSSSVLTVDSDAGSSEAAAGAAASLSRGAPPASTPRPLLAAEGGRATLASARSAAASAAAACAAAGPAAAGAGLAPGRPLDAGRAGVDCPLGSSTGKLVTERCGLAAADVVADASPCGARAPVGPRARVAASKCCLLAARRLPLRRPAVCCGGTFALFKQARVWA